MKSASTRAVTRTVRAMRRTSRRVARESLSPDDIQARMVAVIVDAVGERGTVAREDFLRANIPAAAIQPNFSRALARAREANPELGKLVALA